MISAKTLLSFISWNSKVSEEVINVEDTDVFLTFKQNSYGHGFSLRHKKDLDFSKGKLMEIAIFTDTALSGTIEVKASKKHSSLCQKLQFDLNIGQNYIDLDLLKPSSHIKEVIIFFPTAKNYSHLEEESFIRFDYITLKP